MEYDDYYSEPASGGHDDQPKPSKSRGRGRDEQPSSTEYSNYDETYQSVQPQSRGLFRKLLIGGGATGFVILLIWLLAGGEKSSSPDGALSEQYRFDDEGRLLAQILPNGDKTEFIYNTRGLLAEVKSSAGATHYGYDENGNRIWMRDQTGSTEYYYDAFDRMVGVISKHSPWRWIDYEYDPWNRVRALRIFNLQKMEQDVKYRDLLAELNRDLEVRARQWRNYEFKFNDLRQRLQQEPEAVRQPWLDYEVKYRHDLLGNLIDVTTKWGNIHYSHYPEKGLVERHLPNGIKTSMTTSPDGLLKSLLHENRAGQLIAEYRYDYNAAGKVVKAYESTPEGSKAIGYVWDTRGYLKELHLPDGNKIRYSYDAMGNRLSQEDQTGAQRYEYDQLGRLISDGSFKYEWNRNGNLISRSDGQWQERIKYNGALPAQIKTPETDAQYKWDGDRNLIFRKVGNESTHYLQNPLAPRGFTLAEFDQTNKLTASYLYGDVLLGQQDANGQMQFFLEDGFNSIRHLMDMNGKLTGRWNFTPFAEPIDLSGETKLNFRTAGERFLSEIPIYFTDERMFNPKLGWYLMPNPFGFMERFDSFNKYAYWNTASGNWGEPICNQTHKSKDVLVGGVTARYPKIQQETEKYFGSNSLGIPVNSGLNWGVGDGVWAAWDQVTGGFNTSTAKNLFSKLLRQKEIATLAVHSHGAITLGNLHQEIDAAINNGSLVLGKVVFLGAQPNEKLIQVLTKHNISYEIVAAIPGGSFLMYKGYYYDPITVVTTPNRRIGEVIAPNAPPLVQWLIAGPYKLVALLAALPGVPGPFSFEAHSLDYLLDKKEGPPGPFNAVTKFYEKFYGFNTNKLDDDDGSSSKGPDWPGGGGPGGLPGGPGGAGSPFGKGEPFNDLFTSAETQLGGIELAATAQFMGNLGSITGAVYDPEKQCLVLLSEQNRALPPMKPEDLAIALISVFGPMPQDLQFSLDPDDPKNPRGKWQKAVYIPHEILAGTSFGQAMFEADWLLKQYSFGVRVDSSDKVHEKKSSVPGFKSTADLAFVASGNAYGKESWARLWIVADDRDNDKEHNMTLKLASDSNSIYYDVAKMAVRAKKQVPDPSSPTGLRDVDTADDPTAAQFAGIFTELYDEIAQESPEFGRVKELAKAVALAKWLKQQKIPVDMAWIAEYADKRIKTAERVKALSVTKEESSKTYVSTLHLFGGVDVSVKPKFVKNDVTTDRLQKTVITKLREKDTGPIFSVQHDGKMLRAWVLPATKTGQEMWKNLPPLPFSYQLNNQGKILRVISGGGKSLGDGNNGESENGSHAHSDEDTTEYGYDAHGKLNSVKISSHDGWQMLGERNGSSSLWTSKSPRGNTFKYQYGGAGYLSEIEVDGRRWAAYEIDPKQLQARIRYNDYTETLGYNRAGQITRYERATENSGAETERLILDYDKSGNLTRIGGAGAPAVTISYGQDGISPTAVATPQAKMRFEYDGDKRIKTITHSSGVSANYTYDGKLLKNLQLIHQGRQAEYRFDENGMVQSRDFLGGVAEYGYANGRLTSVTQEQDSARYVYDDRNRLLEIHFPGGGWIEYRYDEEKSRGKKTAASKGQILTISTHAAHENKP